MNANGLTELASQLRSRVTGDVFGRGDSGYDEHRLAWNRSTDQHPALILVASDVDDIVTGVGYAREARLGIGIQSTGHGLQHPADDGFLIVTSRLKGVTVDAVAGTARLAAGTVWQEVLDAATPHGLAPLLGSSPNVGAVGYTLGGGLGWLARRFGLSADKVRAIDVVTADGVLRRTNATENSDLFWGLRGGGGNFGVVTSMEIELVPVAAVYGGSLTYPVDMAGPALRFYREWTKSVPDELTSSIVVVKFPSLPFVPEAMRGKIQVHMRAAYAGTEAAGAALLRPWLGWQAPIANTFREMPFREIGAISNDPVDPVAGTGSHEMLDDLADDIIDLLVRHATDAASPLLFTEIRHAGGAIARVPADANAIGHRSAPFFLQLAALTPTPEIYAAANASIARYKSALRPLAGVRGSVYLNFMKGDEARRRVKDAYPPATYQRLLALKGRTDPDNLFRFSYQLVTG